jgi:D-alanyl-D-alanine carboxypeptidase/D-alanyl-D-alanine-endopeptidase (penicillin-binding protein 4)
LPILGRDGTLADVLNHSPVAGHAQIKTGNRGVAGNGAGQINVLGNGLAGYVTTSKGRRVVLAIAVGTCRSRRPKASSASSTTRRK